MRFVYKAQKATGEFYEGEREAADKYVLSRGFQSAGETLISAREETEKHRRFSFLSLRFSRIGVHEKAVFARNLGGMIGAGLPLSRALSVLERQTRNPKLRGVFAALAGRIAQGASLSQSLSEFPAVFPPLFVSMTKAGEEGGTLSSALIVLSDRLDRAYLLERKVRSALLYPAIIVLTMIVIGVVMFIYVVPKLTDAFRDFNVALPLSTRIVIGISDFFKGHSLAALLLLLIAALAAYAFAKSRQGKRALDFVTLHLPVVSPIVREANAARMAETLSSLLSAGVPMLAALDITADVLGNSYFKGVLVSGREAVQKGETLSSVFERADDIYPVFMTEMLAVGEETGKLSQMLKETGDFFESEVDQQTKDLSTVIEPFLMVVVGVAVGFFAVAMISPAYSLMQSI